jgi:hypothetical protein
LLLASSPTAAAAAAANAPEPAQPTASPGSLPAHCLLA